jgi:hypothetical protein
VITLEQHLFVWFKNKDITPNYAKSNNLHVIWSGGVIDTCDGCDLVNVVFQFGHLNKIIARLETCSPFRELHQEDRENFITSAIRAIKSFMIHEVIL